MDLDAILQTIANHLSAEVVQVNERDLTSDLLKTIPARTARMYQCLPVGQSNGTLKIALVDPLNPGRMDELGFVVKQDIQLVVADPVQVQRAIEKYYPKVPKAGRASPIFSRNSARTRKSPPK